MPKSRPSQVIVHRLELQDFEREQFEKYMEAQTWQSYASAAKEAAIPAGILVVCGVAYIIADGIYDFWDKHRDRLSTVYTRVTDPDIERLKEEGHPWWRIFDLQYILGFKD
jgi:hypothetical protein